MLWYQTYQNALLGCAGGALPDILRLIAGRHGDAPSYLGSIYFWISLVLLIFLGGGAAHLLHPEQWISALAIGYSAPSVLSKLLSDPKVGPAERSVAAPSSSLRGWWAA